MFNMKRCICAGCVVSTTLLCGQVAQAAVLAEYDAAIAGAGNEPQDVSPAWTVGTNYTAPLVNNGAYLLQDDTANANTYAQVSSPAFAGLMQSASGEYGIEFRVRPLTDITGAASSDYANLAVFWGDEVNTYSLSIDLDSDNGDTETTGGLTAKGNTRINVVTGIDWSVAHTVFVGYRSAEMEFDIYVDGVLENTLVGLTSLSTSAPHPFFKDNVVFGDGTTGGVGNQAAEWYSVKLHDVAAVPEPASLVLAGLGGALLLVGRRRHRR